MEAGPYPPLESITLDHLIFDFFAQIVGLVIQSIYHRLCLRFVALEERSQAIQPRIVRGGYDAGKYEEMEDGLGISIV